MSNFKGYGGDDLPDPKEILNKLKANGRWVGLGVIVLLLILAVSQSVYTVQADEQAVVLRLGKPTGALIGPGLHFRVPLIDEVFIRQTTRMRQLEFGFRTDRADVTSRVDETGRPEGLMLTGDLELVNVQWTVLYKISDIESYLFNVRDVEKTIQDISASAVRLLVGDRSSDEVMTIQREAVAEEAKRLIQDALDHCSSGIMVDTVALRQVEPPREAQEAFNKVNEARARKQQTIELAKREKEARVSPMRGRRDAVIAEARGRRDRVIKEAEGEAARFLSITEEYLRAPDVTKTWLYLQTMQRVLQKTGRKFIVEAGSNVTQFLPLGDLGFGGAPRVEGRRVPHTTTTIESAEPVQSSAEMLRRAAERPPLSREDDAPRPAGGTP